MRKKLNPLLARLFDAMAANRPPPRFGIGWLEGRRRRRGGVAILLWLTLPPRPAAPVVVAEAPKAAVAPMAPAKTAAPSPIRPAAMVLPPVPPAPRAEPARKRSKPCSAGGSIS
jgi:hypothetical protein